MYGSMGVSEEGSLNAANTKAIGLLHDGPSCMHAVTFVQVATAFVLPLFVHYCWEARSRYNWLTGLGRTVLLQAQQRQQGQVQQLPDQLQQQQGGPSQQSNHVQQGRRPVPDDAAAWNPPPTLLEVLVALTVTTLAWLLLGKL